MILQRLRQVRLNKGLSQQDIADILSIPLPTYRSYEQGRREPNHEILKKMSDVLDVSIDYLLGKDDLDSLFVSDPITGTNSLSDEETRFIHNFISLPSSERVSLLRTIEKLMNK